MSAAPVSSAPSDRQLAWLWAGVVLALLVLAPFGRFLAGFVPPCPFKALTGIPCPSCGVTRAALALAQLDPAHALMHYPLQTLSWLFFLGGGSYAALQLWRRRPLPRLPRRLPLAMRIGLVAMVAANWLYSIITGV